MKEDNCPIHPEVRLIPVTDEEYGLTTNRCALCDIAAAPEKQCPTCTCSGPFITPGCPVHLAKPKLADGTELNLNAGRWRKSRLGERYNGKHRD